MWRMKSTLLLACLFAFVLIALCEDDIKQDKEPYLYTEAEFTENVPNKRHFVMFYAPWCGHCQRLKPIWAELTSEINDNEDLDVTMAKVDCTSETKLCSDQGVLGYPTLKLYNPGLDAFRHVGARDIDSLRMFVTKSVEPLPEGVAIEHNDGLYDLTADGFDKHIAKGRHFIKFYAPWCGHCKRLEPTWSELAKAHTPTEEDQDDVRIARVDCTVHQSACSAYEVRGYPTLLWFEDGKKIKKYQNARDLNSFEKFIKEMKDLPKDDSEPSKEGAVPPSQPPKAEEKQKEEDVEEDSSVIELDAKNFEYHTATDVTFIKFYAPWCGFCKRLAPIWDQLSNEVFPDDLTVKIAKMDCTDNSALCREYDVKGYPTLILFKDGEKIAKYTGSRTSADFKSFIISTVATDNEASEERAKDEL